MRSPAWLDTGGGDPPLGPHRHRCHGYTPPGIGGLKRLDGAARRAGELLKQAERSNGGASKSLSTNSRICQAGSILISPNFPLTGQCRVI